MMSGLCFSSVISFNGLTYENRCQHGKDERLKKSN